MPVMVKMAEICRVLLIAGCLFALSACGGGGSNVKPSLTGTSPPPPPPAEDPPIDAQLSITNTYAAHEDGFDGAGVTIGVVDSGIMRSNPTVAGRVKAELIYVDPSQNNTSIDDVVGHGTWVSGIAAGAPFADFPGGIAPGASLVSARIISDDAPSDHGQPPSVVTASDAQFFGAVNTDLINLGVNVMNNSWGGITWDTSDPSVNQAFHDAYSPFVNQADGLVVFAAGNDSDPNPSTIAALPSIEPDLEKGWLTVVAVDSNNPTQLEGYSNKCGIAMDYCLAAPGDVIVLDKDTTSSTTNPIYDVVEGTSFAAPQVSGAAALVWQAFPYFDNDLVRQTLLGTADDLGTPGPDPVFGYGELDVGKAVLGPAKFDWGDVSVSFDGMTSTWANDISGTGGLIKNGTGTLVLGGSNTYSGGTQVLGGSLQPMFALPGDITIGSAGTLDNPPRVDGSITNSGTLLIQANATTVGGDYTQTGTGTLSMNLGALLLITGAAQLDGTLNILGAQTGYVTNDHTDVLEASSVAGTFAQLTTSPGVFLDTTIQYTSNSVWLDTTSLSITQTAQAMAITDPAALSAATRMQDGFDAINGRIATGGAVSGALLQGAGAFQHAATPAAALASLQSLSGQLHAASAAMLFDTVDATSAALSDRFDDVLTGAASAGSWTGDLGWQGDLQRGGYTGATFQNTGNVIGNDFRIGSHAAFGYAVAQSRGYGKLDEAWDHNQVRTDSYALYGGFAHGSWYLDGQLGGGRFQQDMQRLLLLGDITAPIGSTVTGSYANALLETGCQLQVAGARVTPYAQLGYQHLNQGGFAEQGGYGFGLAADAHGAGRIQGALGVRAARGWELANGLRMQLDAGATWRHALRQYGAAFDATFTSFDDWLPLTGVGLSRDYTTLDVGLGIRPARDFGMRLGIEQERSQRQRAGNLSLQGFVSF